MSNAWKWFSVAIVASIVALLFLPILKVEAQTPSKTMVWTAPGDDGNVGRASSYEMRFSRTAVGTDTLAWWTNANVVPNMPLPSASGARDSVAVAFGSWNMTYYVVMKACDDGLPASQPIPIPNCSGWSNVAVVTFGSQPDVTPPNRIIDLIGR